ncbi:glycosyltransferase family 117 protein [Taibaiella chishuiensis]|uniref:Uncharacterized protein DUF2723 n=1 Tax=Taibaiella chishuiensis TaxID=1434707 RepID=A0A2P8DBE2_9BACT|nr:DUF2723 domain-containing protein [Taibaiella chishuiensis]PSK94487.1 uncharacterized protein DUF2723 [Taibaiella chishuiensis]
MNFRKINNLTGWIVFAVSYIVYLATMERTVSFWDCGEFLSTAYRLEVGHSPGAPLFMLLGRLFGMFADPQNVALYINSLSALMSGLTILFLFWTITHFARKLLVQHEDDWTTGKMVAIMGAGAVGALAYTFSDTFWFSAVEAEVYATSSFFTAIVFWAILKWEHNADAPHADRWLVLISYLMGLSIGVHLLNLLTIPALAMVYYFRRFTPTLKGGILAFILGCVLLGTVQVGLIQGVPILASKFELLFVNSFGLPLDSGAIFFMLLLVALFAFLLIWAKKKGKYILHMSMICVVFALIGYSSYVSIIIRSRADVPIDMTNPDDMLSLISYLQRDQYGAQPIVTGPDFDSKPSEYKPGKPVYAETKKDGKVYYEQVGNRQSEPVYAGDQTRFFPRIYSSDPSHENFYRQFLNIQGTEAPTGADNYKFFFKYQLNWMWWRYFLWNYAGRQNDYQGTSYGEAQNGNWFTGIKPVDKFFGRGDIDQMPDSYKNNRAHNQLYFLPFILGILGMVYQFNRDKRDGVIISLLFFFTGIAIVLYLNNTPQQPRERDYAYAGATYAFAVWIGLGVLMVTDWFRKALKQGASAATAATAICLLAVPVLMAAQEWDDHDRSQKTLARSTAYNVLSSCDSNAILFTIGDNDTYPLWYMQEIEGYRKDVRIINTSLIAIDWYIDQLRNKINDADAVPMLWKPQDYQANKRDVVFYREDPSVPKDRYFDIEQVLQFVTSDDRRAQAQIVTGEYVNMLPTKNISVKVDKDAVIRNGLVSPADAALVDSQMLFTLSGNTLTKGDLAFLNILAGVAKEGFKRPIYFSCGFAGGGDYQGLDEYVQMDGLANKLVPIRTAGSSPQIGAPQRVNLNKSLDLYTKKFLWGGAERKDVYFDEKNRYMMMTYRFSGSKVADALIRENRKADAITLLDKITNNITYEAYPYDQSMWSIADAYYKAGAPDKARKIGDIIVRDNTKMLNYILNLPEGVKELAAEVDAKSCLGSMQFLAQTAGEHGDTATAQRWAQSLQAMAQQFGVPLNK